MITRYNTFTRRQQRYDTKSLFSIKRDRPDLIWNTKFQVWKRRDKCMWLGGFCVKDSLVKKSLVESASDTVVLV